ncbi:MAG: hypothetical protein JOZ29_10635 [Deltaproteobacteria bacterium]|nr:hypothetical protein [Deltaproteobacteria bacterium]
MTDQRAPPIVDQQKLWLALRQAEGSMGKPLGVVQGRGSPARDWDNHTYLAYFLPSPAIALVAEEGESHQSPAAIGAI